MAKKMEADLSEWRFLHIPERGLTPEQEKLRKKLLAKSPEKKDNAPRG